MLDVASPTCEYPKEVGTRQGGMLWFAKLGVKRSRDTVIERLPA